MRRTLTSFIAITVCFVSLIGNVSAAPAITSGNDNQGGQWYDVLLEQDIANNVLVDVQVGLVLLTVNGVEYPLFFGSGLPSASVGITAGDQDDVVLITGIDLEQVVEPSFVGPSQFGVDVELEDGNDHFENFSHNGATVEGGRGDDTLLGGPAGETLVGYDGDDVINGNGGNDFLDGERGDDCVFGGPGDDELRGGDGFDQLDGGEGDDLLHGATLIDAIDPRSQPDGERDLVTGGPGADCFLYRSFRYYKTFSGKYSAQGKSTADEDEVLDFWANEGDQLKTIEATPARFARVPEYTLQPISNAARRFQVIPSGR